MATRCTSCMRGFLPGLKNSTVLTPLYSTARDMRLNSGSFKPQEEATHMSTQIRPLSSSTLLSMQSVEMPKGAHDLPKRLLPSWRHGNAEPSRKILNPKSRPEAIDLYQTDRAQGRLGFRGLG